MAAQAEGTTLPSLAGIATTGDPQPHRAVETEIKEEDESSSRETKRRRTCVSAIEIKEKQREEGSNSFSFDARSIGPIEITPKFGSFNPSLSIDSAISDSPLPMPEKVAAELSSAEEVVEEEQNVSEVKNVISEGSEKVAEEEEGKVSESKNVISEESEKVVEESPAGEELGEEEGKVSEGKNVISEGTEEVEDKD